MTVILLLDSGGAASTSAAIVDTALNPLAPGSLAQMLGFTEPTEPEEALALRIYLFLIEAIRIEDANNGQLFVKRYLEGPQAVWDQNQAKIFAIKDLWDITKIPDDFLPFLKNIVGWTRDLEGITDQLDLDTLRRLIASSVALWKVRGIEDAMVSILTFVTGARIRSWNWFDYRWVVDETGTGHEADGRDPWLIAADDTNKLNVRIMDDGAINRSLMRDLVNLFRPTGERIEINYLLLLDLFNVDGDDGQWGSQNEVPDSGVLTVDAGEGQLLDDTQEEQAWSIVANALTWSQYVFSARLKGDEAGLMFYWQDADNFYHARYDSSTTALILEKRVAGTDALMTSVPWPVGPTPTDTFFMFKVQIAAEGATNRIVCFVDGVELINTTDSEFSEGATGILHLASGTATVDEVEVMPLPADTDFVDINSP